MTVRMKNKTKKYISYWTTFFIAVSSSWFVWKTWDKVDLLLGDGNIPYMVAGGVLLLAIVFGIGHFSFKKLVDKFR